MLAFLNVFSIGYSIGKNTSIVYDTKVGIGFLGLISCLPESFPSVALFRLIVNISHNKRVVERLKYDKACDYNNTNMRPTQHSGFDAHKPTEKKVVKDIIRLRKENPRELDARFLIKAPFEVSTRSFMGCVCAPA